MCIAFIMVLYKSVVSYSTSWLHVDRTGESESGLNLRLKYLDIFSLPPRAVIWIFNNFGRNYEMDCLSCHGASLGKVIC